MKAAADIQLYVVALLLGLEQIERSTARDEEQGIEQGLPSGARMVAVEATTQTRGGTLL